MKFSFVLVKLSLSIACLLSCGAVVRAQDAELVRHLIMTRKRLSS